MKHHIMHIPSPTSFAVFSDVHLRDPNDAKTKLFLQALEQCERLSAVFFIGDIFDFIAANKPYFMKVWSCVWEACNRLQKHKVEVYFLEGNHDFGFVHFSPHELGNSLSRYGDFDLCFDHEQLGWVALSHGDLLTEEKAYLRLRKILKSYRLQWVLRWFMPSFLLHKLCMGWSRVSRYHEKPFDQKQLPLPWQQAAGNGYWCGKRPAVCVLGHIHQHVDQQKDGTHYLVGPSWDMRPSYLLYQPGTEHTFVRRWLDYPPCT